MSRKSVGWGVGHRSAAPRASTSLPRGRRASLAIIYERRKRGGLVPTDGNGGIVADKGDGDKDGFYAFRFWCRVKTRDWWTREKKNVDKNRRPLMNWSSLPWWRGLERARGAHIVGLRASSYFSFIYLKLVSESQTLNSMQMHGRFKIKRMVHNSEDMRHSMH